MRYDLESMLPINAFSPRGGRGPFSRGMTLEGGGKGGGGGGSPAPDPNIGLAQKKMAEIQEEYLNEWRTNVWPQMKEQAMKQEVRADEQFALDREIQGLQIDATKKALAEYETYGKPMREDIYKAAQEYDTEANRERLAQEAIGDVKGAFGIQAQDLERRNQSFGINPTSGRSVGTANAIGAMQAATEASAATRVRTAAEQLGLARKMDAIGLTQGQFGNQATSTALALNAGGQALNAGQVPMANYGQMSSAMGNTYGGASQGYGQIGNLGVQTYNIQSQNYQAEQNRQAQQNAGASAGFGSAIGAIGGAAMKYAPAMIAASDIRTKENITAVGKLPNGLTVYEFEYKSEFKNKKHYGKGRHRGLMAHEVEAVIPEAVIQMEDGYKAIDYSKVQ
jgi:hypothetical protein